MARIWYSVCGEGYGHATRSEVVIKELLKRRHEVIITAYGKAFDYLEPRFTGRVHEIDGHTYTYEDNTLRVGKSIGRLLVRMPLFMWKNLRRLHRIIRPFKPDLLITDFESASAYYALFNRIPAINLDNIHALKEFDMKRQWFVAPGMRLLQPKGAYVIPTFTKAKARGKAVAIPPIIREEILKAKPQELGHALVYQTSSTYGRMLPILKKIDRTFIIYGMGERKREGNLVFKGFSEQGFLQDLASASYVVMNGGFTLMTEALALKKPVLSIPVKNQIEQVHNGRMLAKGGWGAWAPELTFGVIKDFEKCIPRYKSSIMKLPRWKNEHAIVAVERCIAQAVGKTSRAKRGVRDP